MSMDEVLFSKRQRARRDDGSLDLLAAFVSRMEIRVGYFSNLPPGRWQAETLLGYNSTRPENVQTLGTPRE